MFVRVDPEHEVMQVVEHAPRLGLRLLQVVDDEACRSAEFELMLACTE